MLVEPALAPQSAAAILDDLAVDFLTTERSATVAFNDAGEEGWREIGRVVGGLGASGDGGFVGDQFLEKRQRTRCRGDDRARMAAETECELEHVPRILGASPFGELIAPGGVELRPAQVVGIVGGEHLGDGSVRPLDLVARDVVVRTLARGVDREQAGNALDHDAADLCDGEADEGDAAGGFVAIGIVAEGASADPFSTGAGLARATSAENEPSLPGLATVGEVRNELIVAGPERPVVGDANDLVGA